MYIVILLVVNAMTESKVKFDFRSLIIADSISRDLLKICACLQEIIVDKNATTAAMTETVSALVLIVISITHLLKSRIGIHPHGYFGGTKAHRKIIAKDKTEKLKNVLHPQRKNSNHTS